MQERSGDNETPMTKTEREELRRVVRQDFKVLAEEMVVREREMAADIEQRVALRFEPSEEAMRACGRQVADIVATANEQISDAIAEASKSADGYKLDWRPLSAPYIEARSVKREEMRRAAMADLTARVAQAKMRVHRQEADLLKKLATGALQSDEARSFLAGIPSVAELVPAARLAELEAQFDAPDVA